MHKNQLKLGWGKIELFGKHRLASLRRLSKLEKLVSNKQKHLLFHGLLKLRANLLKLKQSENKEETIKEEPKEEEKVVQPVQPQRNDKQL